VTVISVTCPRVPVVYMGMENRYGRTAPLNEMTKDSREEMQDDPNA
jgi:hypothetical protein